MWDSFACVIETAWRGAHARASARGTPPLSHPITPPQFDLMRCAATREKVNYAVNESTWIYVYKACVYIAQGISLDVLPTEKRNFSISLIVDRIPGVRLGFNSGSGHEKGRKDEGVRRARGGEKKGVYGGKYLFAPVVPQDQSLRRWRCSVSWTILHSGTGIMRGLIGRSSTSNRRTGDGCNLQGKWSRNSSPSERSVLCSTYINLSTGNRKKITRKRKIELYILAQVDIFIVLFET